MKFIMCKNEEEEISEEIERSYNEDKADLPSEENHLVGSCGAVCGLTKEGRVCLECGKYIPDKKFKSS